METFESITLEVKSFSAAAWTDATADVRSIRGQVGIQSTDFMSRVGDGGKMTVIFDNSSGAYGRNGINTIQTARLKFKWDGAERVKFVGFAEPGGGRFDISTGVNTAEITFRDWMSWAIEYPIDLIEYQTNLRIDEAVQKILDTLPIVPKYKNFNQGYYIFPDVFDIGGGDTTAGGEFVKLANSELGYIFLRFAHPDDGELVVHNRRRRKIGIFGDGALTPLPKYSGDNTAGALQTEGGAGYLLLEDGTSKLLLADNETITVTASDLNATGANEFVKDAHYYGYVALSVRPRDVGTSPEVLWTMESSIEIAPGETIDGLRGRYRDPSGGASYINGIDMIAPVANTDYKAYSNKDGTGTDLTDNLSVDAVFGRSEVELSLTNTGTTTLYTGGDILMRVRGTAVRVYDALTIKRDVSRVSWYTDPIYPFAGRRTLSFDLYYQDDIDAVHFLTGTSVYWKNYPRITSNALSFIANSSRKNMRLWMYGDVGTTINVNINTTQLLYSDEVTINGYTFEVEDGIVKFTIIPFEDNRAVITG